jgi:hypothetical protein
VLPVWSPKCDPRDNVFCTLEALYWLELSINFTGHALECWNRPTASFVAVGDFRPAASFVAVGAVHLSLSIKLASHLTVFFSHNKSANSTFSHDLSAKQTGRSIVSTHCSSKLPGRNDFYTVVVSGKMWQAAGTHSKPRETVIPSFLRT